jgi:hypothetical protein
LTYAQKILVFARNLPVPATKSAPEEDGRIVKKDDGEAVDKISLIV